MGRTKLPDEVKGLKGTLQRCRMEAPSVKGERLTSYEQCKGLPGTGRLKWWGRWMYKFRCEEMIALRLLEPRHIPEIIMYCQLYDLYNESLDKIGKEGLIVTKYSSDGMPIGSDRNSAFPTMLKTLEQMRAISAHYGWTPVDAQKIKVEKEDPMSLIAQAMDVEYEEISNNKAK